MTVRRFMSFHLQSAVVLLIFSGAAVMSMAIFETRQITAWLKQSNDSHQSSPQTSKQGLRSWKILSTLMAFFLLGYCLAAYLVVYRRSEWLTLLTGVVFFFGATFVLFSVNVYATTLRQLIASQVKLREESDRATQALTKLRQVQHNQMLTIHTEKMHSLSQMSAGIAHKINNPVNFIHGNLDPVQQYATDLLALIDAYEQQATQSSPTQIDIATLSEEIDLDFIRIDLFKILRSMELGSDRIREIVGTMRNFSRLDESQRKLANVTEGIDSTLMMLQGKLNDSAIKIEVSTDYDPNLPPIYGDHGAINQALLQVLSNAIESFDLENSLPPEQLPTIKIRTQQLDSHWAKITISDNGKGIDSKDINHIFDPFFTTKPIGKGTGLGLAMSHQIIVEQHRGELNCCALRKGTAFVIKLPIS